MKLFMVYSPNRPNVYIKADTDTQAREKYLMGFSKDADPVTTIEEVTMELLMKLAPEEFLLNSDTSF